MNYTANTVQEQEKQTDNALTRRPLLWYFILAYALAWLLWSPYVLSTGGGLGLIPFTTPSGTPIDMGIVPTIIIVLGALGPALAAIIMNRAIGGWAAVGHLLRRMVQVRAGFQWYLIVLFLPLFASLLLSVAFDSANYVPAIFSLKGLIALGVYLFSAVLSMVLGSPLGEEPGWRGFALPRLQEQHGPLLGSLFLAVLWALWHLPLFFTGWGRFYALIGIPLAVLLFGLTIIGYTYVFTWVYNNTRGSLFIAILLHAAINSTSAFSIVLFPQAVQQKPTPEAMLGALLALAGLWLLIAGVVIVMTKGKLSYRKEQVPSAEGAPQVEREKSNTVS
jgi:membrane protease YdiL (CAAX protease family)